MKDRDIGNEIRTNINIGSETLADRLKRFYESNYSTQREFAEAVGINSTTLYRYMKGISKPTLNILAKMQNSGLSINWLLSGEGSMYSKKKGKEENKEM